MTRETEQRKAIREVFENTNRPLTPQEVLETAKSRHAGLGIATVYRNLKTMHEDGSLDTVELPGEPTRYERSGLDHHHHFHCKTCSRVFDVSGCVGNFHQMIPPEFHVESHEILFYGTCSVCNTEVRSGADTVAGK